MLKSLFLLASVGGMAFAEVIANISHFDCGTNQADHAKEELIKAHQELGKGGKGGSHAARALFDTRQNAQINVDTYFHVVVTKAKEPQYSNWEQMVQDQLAVMNNAYKPANVAFTLKGRELTTNDKWAVGADADMAAMKKELRKGSYAALNIYFQSDLAGGILGVCTMPSSIGSNPTPATYQNDGCNVQAGTLPKGSTLGYNQGMTAVHETGHWMGLLHTFEGNSCTGDGDMIADTRAESQSTDGCPTDKNSCPDLPGVDPIHNYMDYSIDSCYEGFTDGQVARMKQLWGQFRNGK
ncbi:Peptidase M43 pregnancy-associated plasma-A [Macrophomina phaseolina MS6]|uniref:Peptidase M43 pregnancy-associated plasma-A n=1 Tax=Macrophomina phaseolina (strain MS6) TaxID=1126212 RepID=K2S3Q2_MACPH|nr:Peptidase M43 pregnancy-associated plasma-A [Macrophomina phaseolina MS6]